LFAGTKIHAKFGIEEHEEKSFLDKEDTNMTKKPDYNEGQYIIRYRAYDSMGDPGRWKYYQEVFDDLEDAKSEIFNLDYKIKIPEDSSDSEVEIIDHDGTGVFSLWGVGL